jgi:hypothetical protein
VPESPLPAQAHYSYGRWVAHCPTDSNAMLIELGQTRFECGSPGLVGSDGTTANIDWPTSTEDVEKQLRGLPVEQQNWTPPRIVYASPAAVATTVTLPRPTLFVPAVTIATTASFPAVEINI